MRMRKLTLMWMLACSYFFDVLIFQKKLEVLSPFLDAPVFPCVILRSTSDATPGGCTHNTHNISILRVAILSHSMNRVQVLE